MKKYLQHMTDKGLNPLPSYKSICSCKSMRCISHTHHSPSLKPRLPVTSSGLMHDQCSVYILLDLTLETQLALGFQDTTLAWSSSTSLVAPVQ